MPATKRIFKVDTRDVEEVLAMSTVTGDIAGEEAIRLFTKMFNIPIDEAGLKAKVTQYQVIANAIKKASK